MHDSTTDSQVMQYNAGYVDGLHNRIPHTNPAYPEHYGRGYDNGFMERHDMSWRHDSGEE